MTAAIYYHPEAYTISGPKLMGRNAAGESFLRGFLKHHNPEAFWLQVQKKEHAQHFVELAKSFNKSKQTFALTLAELHQLARPGAIYFPGPSIGEHAFHRAFFGHQAWSLCGITHTTSSATAMDGIVNLITSPVYSWDALICTSSAVQKNVLSLLDAQIHYLKDRLAISKVTLPKLPIIPLGIHTDDFSFSDQDKKAARDELEIGSDAIVVLFTGRLSFHAKAHPLSMYQALQRAAQKTNKKIVLIECGWYANEFIEKAYELASSTYSPSISVLTLDGRDAHQRSLAWACADIFCSLSDNIQETFGIVPIEAMAAGIPVVVSDWDGYKDTVRDGIDGFRIPTVMPKQGLGSDFALRHAFEIDSYDMYCGLTCSLIAVDIQKTTEAFCQLIASPSLRKEMGENGKKRAQSTYDWQVIIPQYEQLWDELKQIREKDGKHLKPLATPWPARMDPFVSFAHYPTQQLQPNTQLVLVDNSSEIAIERVLAFQQLAMVNFANYIMPSDDEIKTVLNSASKTPQDAIILVSSIPEPRRAIVFRALTWLMKLGVLELIP